MELCGWDTGASLKSVYPLGARCWPALTEMGKGVGCFGEDSTLCRTARRVRELESQCKPRPKAEKSRSSSRSVPSKHGRSRDPTIDNGQWLQKCVLPGQTFTRHMGVSLSPVSCCPPFGARGD
ncbi:hypothetical protein FKM82_030011 [Ascaphus truei]